MTPQEVISQMTSGDYTTVKHLVSDDVLQLLLTMLKHEQTRANNLYSALIKVENSLNVANNQENSPIVDTLWLVSDENKPYIADTLMDFISEELSTNTVNTVYTNSDVTQFDLDLT